MARFQQNYHGPQKMHENATCRGLCPDMCVLWLLWLAMGNVDPWDPCFWGAPALQHFGYAGNAWKGGIPQETWIRALWEDQPANLHGFCIQYVCNYLLYIYVIYMYIYMKILDISLLTISQFPADRRKLQPWLLREAPTRPIHCWDSGASQLAKRQEMTALHLMFFLERLESPQILIPKCWDLELPTESGV